MQHGKSPIDQVGKLYCAIVFCLDEDSGGYNGKAGGGNDAGAQIIFVITGTRGKRAGNKALTGVLLLPEASEQWGSVQNEARASSKRLAIGGVDAREAVFDGVVDLLDGWFVSRASYDKLKDQGVAVVTHDDVFLSGEVTKEGHVGDAGNDGNLSDACGFKTFGHKQAQALLLDVAAGLCLLTLPQTPARTPYEQARLLLSELLSEPLSVTN